MAPYITLGHTIPVRTHLVGNRLGPHNCPTKVLNQYRSLIVFFFCFFPDMWVKGKLAIQQDPKILYHICYVTESGNTCVLYERLFKTEKGVAREREHKLES